MSRDEAVRRVLDEHLEMQEKRERDDRLTHVSTVLRYPAPPPRWRKDPRTDRPLRLRLPPGVTQRARAVSLRLPGQSLRAHRDYQTRLLTDAVMTAIAVQEPFTDGFLEGLFPLIRHGAAVGLWQLAVAATSTVPENAVQDAAEEARSQVGGTATPLSAEESAARRRLLLVAEALDGEVAWHSSVRFEVAANIARDMLSGENAPANERLLYEQGSEWNEKRLDLRCDGEDRARCLRGTSVSYDWSGRGGAAVWRAERRVELQDFEDWLIRRSRGPGPIERQVRPPGWLVRIPDTWHPHVLPTTSTKMPEPFATWAATGRLLTLSVGHKQVLWPLTPTPDPPGWAPVPGIEPVIVAARGLRPEQINSLIEGVLVDWSSDDEQPGFMIRLRIPADKAFDFGFINADERRHARTQAREATLQRMTDIIDELPEHQRHHRAELEDAKGDAHLFSRWVDGLGIKFSIVKATWVWPGRSVVDEVLAGTRADVVQWLARFAHKTCTRMLQQSMEQAWHDAFDHHPATHWHPEPPLVTPTNTSAGPLHSKLDADPPF